MMKSTNDMKKLLEETETDIIETIKEAFGIDKNQAEQILVLYDSLMEANNNKQIVEIYNRIDKLMESYEEVMNNGNEESRSNKDRAERRNKETN